MRAFKDRIRKISGQRGASDVEIIVKLLILATVVAGIIALQSCIKNAKLKRMGYVEETYEE